MTSRFGKMIILTAEMPIRLHFLHLQSKASKNNVKSSYLNRYDGMIGPLGWIAK